MSSYINCCSLPYKKNSTDIKTWLTALPAPDYDCGVALPAHSLPKERTDTKNDCYDNPYDVPACGTYGMGKGEWPKPYPTQTFENLSVLTGVTFSYSGTTITATKAAHGLIIGNEPFTISGQIGTNAVLNGSWVVASVVDESKFTFNISTEPTAVLTAATLDFRHKMDFCVGHGFKAVHAKKLWIGRYGFASDYATTPKLATSKFGGYNVAIQYGITGETNVKSLAIQFDNRQEDLSTNESGNISGSSSQTMTAGGITDCHGTLNGQVGTFNYSGVSAGNPYSGSCYPFGVGEGATIYWHNCTIADSVLQALNEAAIKRFCGINGDRGIVTCTIPVVGTSITDYSKPYEQAFYNPFGAHFETYQGKPEDFQAWLSTFDSYVSINREDGTGSSVVEVKNTGSISLSETSISVDVSGVGSASGNTLDPNQDYLEWFNGTASYSAGFHGEASLSSEYTAAQCQLDCTKLLNEWDMTDDAVYPWRTDGNCNVAPMVIRKEISGGVGWGYCDVPADTNLLAIYDGSIYGAPLPAAYYDKGWFDFYEQEYHYQPSDSDPECMDGGGLCYTYGNYAPSYLPTTTTHWTEGALDTSCRSIGGFQPFTRYKESYIYDMPVFVMNSCAFVQNNQEAFWAGKWAEIKEPLPSQNYWGICGVQPNQCATDSHGTGFGITCSPMRDLKVLDAETCEITETDRYPTAFAICGKAAIVSISRDSESGVVTVVHASTPLLRTGDAVDFINAGNTVTVSNVAVTVDGDTQFHFTGSLPTGSFIVSHGATGFSFYDLAPKGYFVRTSSNKYVITAEEGNVQSTGAKVGIIAILPLGSPELGSPKWPARSTVQYTDYPAILPTEYWMSSINQAMVDRFWVKSQDTQISDEGDPAVCVAKNQDGTPCDPYGDPCVPLITPLVEARLHAPTGAPLQFTADNLTPTPQWYKMPGQTDWSFSCSNVWNYGESLTAFTKQYGVANNYGDSLNTTGISTDTDVGWGLADQYFIP